MPYIEELEPGEATGTKSADPLDRRSQGRITLEFNLALLFFSALRGLFSFLVLSGNYGRYPIGGLVVSASLDLVRFVVVALITAGFLEAFWSRLITSIAPVRPLDFQEAFAIVMMTSILFGG